MALLLADGANALTNGGYFHVYFPVSVGYLSAIFPLQADQQIVNKPQ